MLHLKLFHAQNAFYSNNSVWKIHIINPSLLLFFSPYFIFNKTLCFRFIIIALNAIFKTAAMLQMQIPGQPTASPKIIRCIDIYRNLFIEFGTVIFCEEIYHTISFMLPLHLGWDVRIVICRKVASFCRKFFSAKSRR